MRVFPTIARVCALRGNLFLFLVSSSLFLSFSLIGWASARVLPTPLFIGGGEKHSIGVGELWR